MDKKPDIEKSLDQQEAKIRLEKVLAILLDSDLVCLGKLLENKKREESVDKT